LETLANLDAGFQPIQAFPWCHQVELDIIDNAGERRLVCAL
jgi:hypothetical protein